MSCTIAVTGATGNIGRVLSETLLARGHKVRAVGRDAGRLKSLADKGAQACVGSVEDATFVTGCFAGADAAFVMIPPDMLSSDQLGRAQRITDSYVAAVKSSGLKSVVLLSSVGAHLEKGAGIVDTLRILERGFAALSDVDVRVLRPSYFLENIWPQMDLIKNLGFTGGPLAPDTRVAMVATRDIAAVAAARLDDRSWSGHTMEYILGAADYSYNDVAAALGRALGKDLAYMQVPDGDLKAALMQMGMSGDMIDKLLEMSHAINAGKFQDDYTRTPENTTPTTLDDFAQWFAAAYNG